VRVEPRAPEALALVPTQEKVRDRQVFLAPAATPVATPEVVYVLRADGSYTRYRLAP
jgi:hypothetical protein